MVMRRLSSVRRLHTARSGWALIDVIIGGVILGIGLAAVISIAERSLAMQQRSERELVAAQLLDGLLNEVLAVGVVEWQLSRASDGAFDAPFDKWQWQLDIQKHGLGDPYSVMAIARDDRNLEYRVDTLLAPRPENTEDPVRTPETPIDREARYEAQQ
jgi:type II secretory pathway pseudopilin PulG